MSDKLKSLPPELRRKAEQFLPVKNLTQRRSTDSNQTVLLHPSNHAKRES